MFSNLKQLFTRENKDLRKRIYFTFFCLGIFSFGSTITVPWATQYMGSLGFLEIFNLMTGGGLRSFSIFALGVTPYITAQIITQILQMDIVPYFKELKEEGYTGKQKINKITRYLGVLFAVIQGFVFTIVYSGSKDPMVIVKTTLVLTAGTCALLWIGDRITKNGIGNGLSLMIMAGILQSMPNIFTSAFNELVKGETFGTTLGSVLFASFVIVYLLVIVGMVWVQLAERRIPIQYANRTNSAYGGHQNFLPIKINSAGVIPVIFASTLLTIPVTITGFIGKGQGFVEKYLDNTTLTGFILYMALILFFGYFYTFLQMNPEEMAKNLNKAGAYIPGVRPGNDTIEYVSDVLSKLTIVGSIFLMIIAGLPILFSKFSGLTSTVTIGGTGLLIVVGVAIETYKQLESSLVSRSHRKAIRR
ncbi:MAG: preprotein translocase subunit SecY [Bacilli bacterium]|nr:preprotein translocase subunit SecY [Bacilli bacterium]